MAEIKVERVSVADAAGITYHTKRPLIAAGYEYFDQMIGVPLDELGAYLPSETSLKSLAKALGREQEYFLQFGPNEVEVDGEVVPVKRLRGIINLTGTARGLRFETQEQLKKALRDGQRLDPDSGKSIAFGWVDLARYVVSQDKKKRTITAGKPAGKGAGKGIGKRDIDEDDEGAEEVTSASVDNAEIEAMIVERQAMYARDYDTSLWTESDASTLKWLAGMEIRVELLQKAQINIGGFASETSVKLRSEEIDRLLNQIRKIRHDLQISLLARIESANRQVSEDIIKDLATRGKTLIRDRASLLQHCGILQGIFLPNFPVNIDTPSITVRCARCGQPLQWVLVTKEMLALYTEAGAFVPEDAPPGMFSDKPVAKVVKA
jgi:hypothetical protein